MKLEDVIKPLKGRTAVFLFYDGEYTGDPPAEVARNIVKNFDVCFYIISTAKPEREPSLNQEIASLNSCSRVIPLATFIDRPSTRPVRCSTSRLPNTS
jgi:OOP family OmpA-OmpF porin